MFSIYIIIQYLYTNKKWLVNLQVFTIKQYLNIVDNGGLYRERERKKECMGGNKGESEEVRRKEARK